MSKGVYKHISVLELYMHRSIYRLLLIILAMAAVEAGLFYWLGLHMPSFDLAVSEAHLVLPFFAAFLAHFYVVLSSTADRKASQSQYTLKRLQISERSVVLCHFVSCIAELLILWAAQALILFGFMKLWAGSAHDWPAESFVYGPQGLYLAFFRNDFLHAIVPLRDAAKLFSDIVLVLSVAAGCAYIEVRSRMQEKRIFAPILVMAFAPQLFRTGFTAHFSGTLILSGIEAIFGVYCLCAALANASDGHNYEEEDAPSGPSLNVSGKIKEAANA